MEATLVQPKVKALRRVTFSELKRRLDTLEKFRRWQPEDTYKYEWNNGTIEKTPKMVTQQNFYIVDRLIRLFLKTSAFSKGGQLLTEPEAMTSNTQLRIPDMAFFSEKQMQQARKGIDTFPKFAIEFVSDTDSHRKVLAKLNEYFNAGMEVAWLIFPDLGLVYVYTSAIDVVICKGNRVCSANPVMLDFQISASDLFD
jgi:Uma2 family endonuclease